MGSSKVDREGLKAKLQAEFEATLNAVVDSIDNARDGAWIADSEGLSRQALDRFRQQVYASDVFRHLWNHLKRNSFGPVAQGERNCLLSAIEDFGVQVGDEVAKTIAQKKAAKQIVREDPTSECGCPVCSSPGQFKGETQAAAGWTARQAATRGT